MQRSLVQGQTATMRMRLICNKDGTVWISLANVKSRVKNHRPTDVDSLQDAVHEEWNKTDIEWIHHTVDSMPDRCEQVIAARGLYIRYWS